MFYTIHFSRTTSLRQIETDDRSAPVLDSVTSPLVSTTEHTGEQVTNYAQSTTAGEENHLTWFSGEFGDL